MKQINISDDAYDTLVTRHGDLAAFLEKLAEQSSSESQNGRGQPVLQQPPLDSKYLDELAAQQNVPPLAHPAKQLIADFWPGDESRDLFFHELHQLREQGVPREME